MLERKKILVNKTECKGITAGISSVIQPQDCDKHDDSFDQNIDKVVDLLPGPAAGWGIGLKMQTVRFINVTLLGIYR